MYKKLLKEIKKYDRIIIARHVGVDPDALGSQLALKAIIKEKFPKKEVYAIGTPAARFNFMGKLDKVSNFNYDNSLLIVTDLPDKRRMDNVGFEFDKFSYTIKVDHHPFIEKFCDFEIIDDKASSTCQMLIEFCLANKLKMTEEIGRLLFVGLVADTNRFMFEYTTAKTFKLVASLVEKTGIDINELYDKLMERPENEVRMFGYMNEHMVIEDNGLAYIIVDDELLKKYQVDPACPSNLINNFQYLKDVKIWMSITEDKHQNNVRVAMRSKGIIINKLAEQFNGGGHKFASGARLKDMDEIENFLQAVRDLCK